MQALPLLMASEASLDGDVRAALEDRAEDPHRHPQIIVPGDPSQRPDGGKVAVRSR
jgi:hypothetical protein